MIANMRRYIIADMRRYLSKVISLALLMLKKPEFVKIPGLVGSYHRSEGSLFHGNRVMNPLSGWTTIPDTNNAAYRYQVCKCASHKSTLYVAILAFEIEMLPAMV